MTRLLFVAACFASALATMDTGYNMGGSKTDGDMVAGDKMDGSMMKGDTGQKNAMDMSSGSSGAVVDMSVAVISSYKGGNAPVEQVSQPTMTMGMMHKVTVGGDAGLVFSPSSLMAAPGDMVEFTFMSQNHTLTQSTFPKPCVKMQGGADSGFLSNPNNTISPPPTFMFQVKDTKPAWFYCKQKKPTSHCGKGMTFSINPTADKPQDMFMQMAMQQNGTAVAMGMGMNSSTPTMMPPSTMPAAAMPPPATSTSAAAPAAPPVPSSSSSPPAVASPPPPQALAAPPASPPAVAAGSSMAMGTGSMANGQCSCSCLCGTASFPAGVGIGMYGGYSGAVPM